MRVLSAKDRVEGGVVDHFYTVFLAHESFMRQPPQSVHLSQAGKVAFVITIDLSEFEFVFDCPSAQVVNN